MVIVVIKLRIALSFSCANQEDIFLFFLFHKGYVCYFVLYVKKCSTYIRSTHSEKVI